MDCVACRFGDRLWCDINWLNVGGVVVDDVVLELAVPEGIVLY